MDSARQLRLPKLSDADLLELEDGTCIPESTAILFFLADSLSIADLALYSYVHCAEEGGFDLTGLEGLRRWFSRIQERPRHIAIDTVPQSP